MRGSSARLPQGPSPCRVRCRPPPRSSLGAVRCSTSAHNSEAVTAEDEAFMRHALELAALGAGRTAPNPAVGCVIVAQGGEVVGQGFHPRAGQPHAEVYALRGAGRRAEGATAYVTLEPCNHHGRTPPCSQALVEVVVGVVDPNPRVGGKGIERLRKNGVAVAAPCLEGEARELNADFMERMAREAAAAG